MTTFGKLGVLCAFTIGLGVSACATETASDGEEAPAADLDAVDPADQGESYNGWTQYAFGNYCTDLFNYARFGHYLVRSSGDTTRGGGGCYVKWTGVGCGSDDPCIANAQAQYGSGAWGYCYSGTCYSRPGVQSIYCALGPNRSDGSMLMGGGQESMNANSAVVGCMTKTAGPNTACGGTNASLYMRTLTTSWYPMTCAL
jgi:hypothetical protein